MAATVKFNLKSKTLYGCSQVAEAQPAVIAQGDTTGAIGATSGSTAVTGTGTAFLLEAALGIYLYDDVGGEIGRVLSVETDTGLTLEANALVTASAAFSTGMGPKNAFATTEFSFSRDITSDSFEYLGDPLERDEITTITDSFVSFDFQTFIKKLGTIAGATPTEEEVPLSEWMTSSGMAIVLETGKATYTNSLETNDYMSVELRMASPDIATDKVYTVTDARGTIDLDNKISSLGKFKFNYQGNLVDIIQKPAIIPDYGNQKFNTAARLATRVISLSNLEVYVTETEPTVGATNFCFSNLSAPNMDGFGYDRYQTSCQEGWSKEGNPTDVTLTIIEDEAGAVYNPQDHIEDKHRLDIKWGEDVAGERVEMIFHKLQLANVTSSQVAQYAGEDLNFRNIGYTSIIIS